MDHTLGSWWSHFATIASRTLWTWKSTFTPITTWSLRSSIAWLTSLTWQSRFTSGSLLTSFARNSWVIKHTHVMKHLNEALKDNVK